MAYLLKNVRAIDPQVQLDSVIDILIEDGNIAAMGTNLEAEGAQVKDCTGKIATPGLLDMHVHLREPGFEQKEDIASGTRAAARGGFTAICCMPNTDPVIDNAMGVEYINARAARVGKCRVHIAGACSQGLKGETLAEMGDMVAHGVVAFTDDGRGVQGAGMMRRIMDYASMFDKPVMPHCQDDDLVGEGQVNEGAVSTRLGLLGWPAEGEEIEIARDIILCRLTGCPLHIQHITTKRGLDMVREAKAEGLPVTCEVTPHHLFLQDEDIKNDYNTAFKVNPPLRTAADNEALIEGLLDGSVDCIVTDHAPHTDYEKAREFELAPFGMIGLETSLALILTNLVHTGKLSYEGLIEHMSINPRKVLRLPELRLEEDAQADITIFDPEEEWIVGEDGFVSRAINSAFTGRQLKGRATDVFVGGKPSLANGEIVE